MPAKKTTKTRRRVSTTKPARKVARKSTAPKEAPKPASKRGPVLIERSVDEILAFIGGDSTVKIMISKKSLIDAKTKGARAAAAAELAEGDEDDDLQ